MSFPRHFEKARLLSLPPPPGHWQTCARNEPRELELEAVSLKVKQLNPLISGFLKAGKRRFALSASLIMTEQSLGPKSPGALANKYPFQNVM